MSLTQEQWNEKADALRFFFETTVLPEHSITLNDHAVITDVKRFVQSHLCCLLYNEKETFLPYMERLIALQQILQANGTVPGTGKVDGHEKTALKALRERAKDTEAKKSDSKKRETATAPVKASGMASLFD